MKPNTVWYNPKTNEIVVRVECPGIGYFYQGHPPIKGLWGIKAFDYYENELIYIG